MNSDWYHSFSIAALIMSVGLIWEVWKIRKHLHLEDLTPTRKWKKAFRGPRHVPKHRPDQAPESAEKPDFLFYKDSAKAAQYLNTLYADSPWAFQDTGELHGGWGSEKGAEREIEVWYNQVKTGRISISARRYGQQSVLGVNTSFELINGRVYEGTDVIGLAMSIAGIVITTSEEKLEARDHVHATMIDTMWQLGAESLGNSPINFDFWGQPEKRILGHWNLE